MNLNKCGDGEPRPSRQPDDVAEHFELHGCTLIVVRTAMQAMVEDLRTDTPQPVESQGLTG